MDIVKYEDLDLKNIDYCSFKKKNDFINYYPMKYRNSFLLFKTPSLYVSEYVKDTYDNFFVYLSFIGKKSNKKINMFYDTIVNVETQIYKDILDVYNDIYFLPSIKDVDENIESEVKEYDKIKLYISDNITIYDTNTKEEVKLKDKNEVLGIIFCRNRLVKCIICLKYVWVSEIQFGCKWEIVQCAIN
jgi:hypothetical protein